MKKGWKIFWIVSGSVIALGCACCMIALGLGVTTGAISERFPDGIGLIRTGNSWYNTGSYEADMSESFQGISSVDVQMSAGEVKIIQSDTNEVKMETANIDSRLRFSYHVEDGELVVDTRDNINRILPSLNKGTLYLYLPKDMVLEEVDLEIGAGMLYADNISAQTLNVDVGAGTAEISQYQAQETDFNCGAGKITASGNPGETATVKCGIGEIALTIDGKETDYSYTLECGIGEIGLGNGNYSGGLGNEKTIYNDTGKEMTIECGIGKVNVNFNQS